MIRVLLIVICCVAALATAGPVQGQIYPNSNSLDVNDLSKRIKRQTTIRLTSGECVVPPYPEHGHYGFYLKVSSEGAVITHVYPGERSDSTVLIVGCDQGYDVKGNHRVDCDKGKWSGDVPQCSRFCTLPSDESIEFNCVNDDQSTRRCEQKEFSGTTVLPKCLVPNYNATVSTMHCKANGRWDVIERCYTGFCKMPKDAPDVEYTCVTYVNSTETRVPCENRVPPGVTVKVECEKRNHYAADMHCLPGGEWSYIAECSQAFCELPQDDGVDYKCVTYENGAQVTRPCRLRVFPGTTVIPKCRQKNFQGTLPKMHCKSSGTWNYVPNCPAAVCELPPHQSVEYTCVTYNNSATITKPCGVKEDPGTTVVPQCRRPNYYGSPSNMHCKPGGVWDYIATCSPECGRIIPDGQPNVINGTRSKHGELPWHAGIYRKTTQPYSQICGGTLVSNTAVISAAHCFWNDVQGLRNAELYAVALGKIYRPWSDTHDADAKYYNVTSIHVPPMFRGASNNYQNDIAVLILDREVTYHTFIRPACLDFDFGFNMRQLQAGNMGKIAGWGLTSPEGRHASVLQVTELPYVPFGKCFDESPKDFQEYITSDKFCAGFLNGTALCEGDSGGGLVFPESEKGIQRYYLRGVVSTAPRERGQCDPNVRTTFTEVVNHERFVKEAINISE